MRLLDAATLAFQEFHGSQIPPYAVLSHRWEDEEVTFEDMNHGVLHASLKEGFNKILQCSRQAAEDKLHYFWVDTCCIDKTSSAELSEAINSMYRWYQNAAVCYAYLSDVSEVKLQETNTSTMETYETEELELPGSAVNVSQFMASKWWTRGWTLQELVAPRVVKFFANNGRDGWSQIGDKISLLGLIGYRTSIDRDVLQGLLDVGRCSIAKRMSWASDRETTRIEDLAYCLLGIFGVNMPLLYGEGERAFVRLQEEIMRQSDDQTLFAWQLEPNSDVADICGPLATSPTQFRRCSELVPVPDADTQIPYSMTNKGLRIDLPILEHAHHQNGVAVLQCSTLAAYPTKITLPIVRMTQQESSHFARDGRYIGSLEPVSSSVMFRATTKTIFMKQEPAQIVNLRSDLLIHVPFGLPIGWKPVYLDPNLLRTTLAEGVHSFLFPAGCRKGAIVFSNQERHVLLLWNLGMEHMGELSCKILCSDKSLHDMYMGVRISDALEYALRTEMDRDAPFSVHGYVGKRNLLELHEKIDEQSNSRKSFTYVPEVGAACAEISQQAGRGQSRLVLRVEFHGGLESKWPLCELEGDHPKDWMR